LRKNFWERVTDLKAQAAKAQLPRLLVVALPYSKQSRALLPHEILNKAAVVTR